MNYQEYLKSDKWWQIRQNITLQRGRCEITGYKTNLQLHHINYDILGKEDILENQDKYLLLVTEKVHNLIHENLLFIPIDPKRNHNTITRGEFLKEYSIFRKLKKSDYDYTTKMTNLAILMSIRLEQIEDKYDELERLEKKYPDCLTSGMLNLQVDINNAIEELEYKVKDLGGIKKNGNMSFIFE
jgi:hypothetical protein